MVSRGVNTGAPAVRCSRRAADLLRAMTMRSTTPAAVRRGLARLTTRAGAATPTSYVDSIADMYSMGVARPRLPSVKKSP